MIVVASITLINIALLAAGVGLARRVHMEEEEILKYKRISELQFNLLNKKIEAMSGNASRA